MKQLLIENPEALRGRIPCIFPCYQGIARSSDGCGNSYDGGRSFLAVTY
jgi:hypothetical protein